MTDFPKISCFSATGKTCKISQFCDDKTGRAVQVKLGDHANVCVSAPEAFGHEHLRRKIDAMEKRCDARFQAVFAAIRQMLATPVPGKKPIGFHTRIEERTKPSKPGNRKRK